MAHEYQNRVKNDHKQQLFEQMSMDKRNKAAFDQALRQAEANEVQQLSIFNNQLNANKADHKKNAMQ